MPCALALTLTACGSSSKPAATVAVSSKPTPVVTANAHLTSAQVNTLSDKAIEGVTALHMQGSMNSGGQMLAVDIQVNEDSGGGTIGTDGTTMPVRLVAGVAYLQMTPDVVKTLIDPSLQGESSSQATFAEQLLMNKWIDSNSSAGKSMTQSFEQMLTLKDMLQNITQGPSDTYTYLGTGVVDGQQVVQYKDVSSDKSNPATIDSFPLNGPLLPIEVDAGSQGSLTMVYNKPVPVTAPPADQLVTLPGS
jgi:hypothetical protein